MSVFQESDSRNGILSWDDDVKERSVDEKLKKNVFNGDTLRRQSITRSSPLLEETDKTNSLDWTLQTRRTSKKHQRVEEKFFSDNDANRLSSLRSGNL